MLRVKCECVFLRRCSGETAVLTFLLRKTEAGSRDNTWAEGMRSSGKIILVLLTSVYLRVSGILVLRM